MSSPFKTGWDGTLGNEGFEDAYESDIIDSDDCDDEYFGLVPKTSANRRGARRESAAALAQVRLVMEKNGLHGDAIEPMARELKKRWEKEAEDTRVARLQQEERDRVEGNEPTGYVDTSKEALPWVKASWALSDGGSGNGEGHPEYPPEVYRAILNRVV